RLHGRTVHHRIVHFAADDDTLVGRYVPVRIVQGNAHSLVGELLPDDAYQGEERHAAAAGRRWAGGRDDPLAMREALALAARGGGNVEPNPRVGALALRDGEIVGRGFHRAWGEPHAEVEVLRDAAKAGARPDTVVV